jgi:hypothetical protein
MREEIEWYRTAPETKDKGVKGFVYRAIRWDRENGKYVLVSGHRIAERTGSTDVTRIEFENPRLLSEAIVTLSLTGKAFLMGKGIVTKMHEDWNYSGDRSTWRDNCPPADVRTGEVSLTLHAEHGILKAFESTIHVVSE